MTLKIAPKSAIFTSGIPVDVITRGRNGKVVEKGLMAQYRRRVKKVTEQHYSSLLFYVRKNMAAGFNGVESGGARLASGVDGSGNSFRYRTAYWPELTRRYRMRKPRSRRVWRKKGSLFENVDASLPRKISGKTRMSREYVRRLSPKGDLVRASHVVEIPNPDNIVLRKMILAPFLHGDQNRVARDNFFEIRRGTADMIVYPEQKPLRGGKFQGRPWVAGFAERYGQEFRRALRRL